MMIAREIALLLLLLSLVAAAHDVKVRGLTMKEDHRQLLTTITTVTEDANSKPSGNGVTRGGAAGHKAVKGRTKMMTPLRFAPVVLPTFAPVVPPTVLPVFPPTSSPISPSTLTTAKPFAIIVGSTGPPLTSPVAPSGSGTTPSLTTPSLQPTIVPPSTTAPVDCCTVDGHCNSPFYCNNVALAATCGGGQIGNGICPVTCCSTFGYCGSGASYCGSNQAPLHNSSTSCGGGVIGNGVCPPTSNLCCSKDGYCGVGSTYCGSNQVTIAAVLAAAQRATCGGGTVGNGICPNRCCSAFGYCGYGDSYCEQSQARFDPTVQAPCGGGSVGNGVCPNNLSPGTNAPTLPPAPTVAILCCSIRGYCGFGTAYCAFSNQTAPAPSGTCGGGNVGNGICQPPTPSPTTRPTPPPSPLPTAPPTPPPSPLPTAPPTLPLPTAPPGPLLCCSIQGFCGLGTAYCALSNQPGPSPSGTCGGGNVGNGRCQPPTPTTLPTPPPSPLPTAPPTPPPPNISPAPSQSPLANAPASSPSVIFKKGTSSPSRFPTVSPKDKTPPRSLSPTKFVLSRATRSPSLAPYTQKV